MCVPFPCGQFIEPLACCILTCVVRVGQVTIFMFVVEQKYFTCSSRESNPGRWIYRQTLYHVIVKAGFYHKAVEVLYT